MIKATPKIFYSRITALTPNLALINTAMHEVRHVKSFANTPANRAIWGNSPQVVYLNSNIEILARVEEDKNKPAIIYSTSETAFSAEEIIELIDICSDNSIDYSGNDSIDLENLENAGILIVRWL